MQTCEPPDHPLLKWQETILLLIVLLTPLFVNFWVEQQFEASKVWLFRTLVWILALLWLGGRLRGFRFRSLPRPIGRLVLLLFLTLALSTLLSPNRYVALFGSLDRANGFLTQASYLLLFVFVATQTDAQQRQQMLRLVVLTAAPICLLGLAQAAGWQPLPVLTDARSPITTTLGRSNFTGAYLALLLPLTLTAARLARGHWLRFLYAALVMLELLVIALTQARAAWIAAAVGVAVLFWLHLSPRWSRRDRWLSGLGGIILMGGALCLILLRGIASGGSIAARWTIWRASLRLLWPRLWLGYGADTLELHFPAVYPPQLVYYQGRGIVVDRAHNWLLDWSLNYGVVTTLIFVALVYFVVRAGWRGLCASHDAASPLPGQHHWLAACLATICAHLAGNLFLFDVAATATLFWLLLAIVTATTTKGSAIVVQSPLPIWSRHGLIVLSLLIMGWAVWLGNVSPLLADAHSWRGTQALSHGNPPAAMAEYAAAVKRQPQRAGYRVAMALTAAQLGDYDRAEGAMREAIALRPADPVLFSQLATVYALGAAETPGRTKLAYAAYERAIALAPTIGLTYQHYADLALRSGDVALAASQAQRAVEFDATDGTAFGILAWAQLQAGNLSAAQAAFEQAVRWEPDSADFQLGLATVLFQQGNFETARQAVQRSLALDPDYAPTLILQQQLRGQ